MSKLPTAGGCEVAVIWIDWYAYHVARFVGLDSTPPLEGRVVGLELVSGVGVHPGLRFREDLPEGLAIETLMPGVSWREAGKMRLAVALWRRLNALQPRAVLVPGYYTLPAIAAALWARLHRRASVLMTESTAFDHKRQFLREWLKKTMLRLLFGWAVTGGRAHVRYLRQLGFPSERIVGCYDVVDNDAIRKGTAALREHAARRDGPAPYFLFVGRLAPEKNLHTLLQGWIAYRAAGGLWPLVLAGDGPERDPLRQRAQETPYAADVHFTGLLSLGELVPYYANAGCFVLPSSREPWGLVVNEAMAAELPVLVSDRCGCREDLVQEGENGFSFDPQDAQMLAALLERMASMPPAERRNFGQRSGEMIAAYTPQGFGHMIAAIVRHADRASRLHLLPEGAP